MIVFFFRSFVFSPSDVTQEPLSSRDSHHPIGERRSIGVATLGRQHVFHFVLARQFNRPSFFKKFQNYARLDLKKSNLTFHLLHGRRRGGDGGRGGCDLGRVQMMMLLLLHRVVMVVVVVVPLLVAAVDGRHLLVMMHHIGPKLVTCPRVGRFGSSA